MIEQKKALQVHSSPNKRQQQGGFTLTEVATVMAIIGILATIAMPIILNWLPNIRLKSAARDLYANMQEAKIQAVKQNKDWAVVFDTTNNKYYVCSDWGADGNWTGANDSTGTGDNVIVKTVSLGNYKSDVAYGSGSSDPETSVTYVNNAIIFSPRGTIDAGCCADPSGCYVYLDHLKDTDSLRIGTFTSGVIRMARWNGSTWN